MFKRKTFKRKKKTTKKYKEDLIKKGIVDIELLEEYKNTKTKIKVLNKKCNHIYRSLASNILRGSGCPICHGIKDNDKFNQIINNKYPGQYEILEEYVNGITKIKVKHKCGYVWKVQPKQLLRSISCPRCRLSKGEHYIYQYLEENKIYYERQYKITDCRDVLELPFDFMIKINNKLKLIEFDGSQHYKDTLYSKNKTKEHDKIKNDYCKNNNIELLRIPYWHLRNEKIKTDLDIFISK